jgi:hypothetical protein
MTLDDLTFGEFDFDELSEHPQVPIKLCGNKKKVE